MKLVQVASRRTEQLLVSIAGEVDEGAADELRNEVARLCDGEGLRAVVQPIVRLTDMVVVGYEALSRVATDRRNRSIQWWLDAATHVDLRSEFEVACWHRIAAHGAYGRGSVLDTRGSRVCRR